LDTKKPEQAKQYLFEAIKVFEKSEADIYLMQAQEAIASMKD
jgi:hypothetical protein